MLNIKNGKNMFSLRICRKSQFIKILSILQYEYVRIVIIFGRVSYYFNRWDSWAIYRLLKVGPDSAFFLMYTITCSVSLGTILASKRCEPWLGEISMSKLRKLTGHLYSKGLIWGKRFVINARWLMNHLQIFVQIV